MFGRHPLSHNPGRTPQVAMIHKFRIGESAEKRHALPFARAAQPASEIRIAVTARLFSALSG
jgi:hypothetical protein